jgi:hypothetical protein
MICPKCEGKGYVGVKPQRNRLCVHYAFNRRPLPIYGLRCPTCKGSKEVTTYNTKLVIATPLQKEHP